MAIDKQALAKKSSESARRHHEKTLSQADDVVNVTGRPKAVKKIALESNAQPRQESVRIPLGNIQPSLFQVRAMGDDSYIESLMESITQSGVITPIIVRPLESNAQFEIVAGHHRFEACNRLGLKDIEAVVRPMTDSEAGIALTADNFVRKHMGVFEKYKHAKLLIDRGFCTSKTEAGKALGVSRTQISLLMCFDDFPDAAKALLEINPDLIGYDQANEIRTLAIDHPDLVTQALGLVAEGALLQTKVRGWVEHQLQTPSLRMPARKEIKISKPGLRSPIKITYTEKEAKIQAVGIKMEVLQKLLEENLEQLVS